MITLNLLRDLTVFHFVIVVLCIVITRVYIRLTRYFADVLRWWSYALLVNSLIYFSRIVLPDPLFPSLFAVIEAVISNTANVMLILMAREIRRGGPRPGPRSWHSHTLLLLLVLLPAVFWGAFELARGFLSGLQPSPRLVDVIVTVPEALFSGYALFRLGKALGEYLLSLRKVAAYAFFAYAVYLLPYPALGLVESSSVALQLLYMNGTLVFKVACTLLLVAVANEYARRRAMRGLMRTGLQAEVFDAPVADVLRRGVDGFDQSVTILWTGADRPALETVSNVLRARGLSGAVLTSEELESAGFDRGIATILTSRFAVILVDAKPTSRLCLLAGMFLAERRECLVLRSASVDVGAEARPLDQVGHVFHSPDEVRTLVESWINRCVVDPLAAIAAVTHRRGGN